MEKSLSLRRSIVFIAAFFILAIGLAVIISWHLRYSQLIQLTPRSPAMEYNVAIAFLAAGLGLLLSLSPYTKLSKIFAFVLVLIGSLSLARHLVRALLHVDVEFDTFIYDYAHLDLPRGPAPMPFHITLSFILSGIAFLVAALSNTALLVSIMGLSALVIAGIGTFELMDYYVHLSQSYNVWFMPPMAIHAAIGFLVLGIGLYFLATIHSDRHKVKIAKIIPFLAIVCAVILVSLFTGAFFAQRNIYPVVSRASNLSAIVGIIIVLLTAAIYLMFLFLRKIKTIQLLFSLMLAHQSRYDVLTKLPNRLLLVNKIGQAIKNAKRDKNIIAVFLFDIDRFKFINDTLGHETGNLVLQQLAKRLDQCTQHNDIAARLSSDEFVLVTCEHKSENDIIRIVHMLLNILSAPFHGPDQDLKLHVTIGISLYPKDGKTAEILLKNADIALNRAKKMSADFRFYTNEMQKQMIERVTIEKQLRRALQNEEFFLNYHPIYNVKTNKISGAEALLRWQHPKKGIIYPAGFISIAEETGLITEIGEWVINEVLRQYQQWLQKKMQPIQVAINLSARQFSHHDLVAILNRNVKKYDIDPHLIDLEITESILMENTQQNSAALQKLKSSGFSLVIDDFGTGYSSLAYLKSFAIDKIKIAQPFVNSLHTDNGIAIVQAILAMAKQLQLGVIAEGVERKIEYDFLVENDCEEIQGFYFSKPLLEADFFNLMQEFSEVGRK